MSAAFVAIALPLPFEPGLRMARNLRHPAGFVKENLKNDAVLQEKSQNRYLTLF
jgi:hypothetical protein